MSLLNQIALKIIKEQELVVGPFAWIEASKVPGLKIVNQKEGRITFESNNEKEIIDGLVNRYERLFGRASHEVCKEAVAGIIGDLLPTDIPSTLR